MFAAPFLLQIYSILTLFNKDKLECYLARAKDMSWTLIPLKKLICWNMSF